METSLKQFSVEIEDSGDIENIFNADRLIYVHFYWGNDDFYSCKMTVNEYDKITYDNVTGDVNNDLLIIHKLRELFNLLDTNIEDLIAQEVQKWFTKLGGVK